MLPLQVIGSNPLLGPVGKAIGILGIGLLVYWTIQAIRDDSNDDVEEYAEDVGASFSNFVVAVAAVVITIGDQLIQLGADLIGLGDPLIIGHIGAGVLGYLGVNGNITVANYVFAFGLLTAAVLIWRAATSRGRGL